MTKPIVNKFHDKYVDKFLSSIDVEIKINNRDKIFARIYEVFCPADRMYYYCMLQDKMQTADINNKRYYVKRISKEKRDYMIMCSRSRQDLGRLAERYGQSEIPPKRAS